MKTLRDKIDDWVDEYYPESAILLADGFEEAFMGIASQFGHAIAVFDRQKCIEILMRDMSEDEAHEYFEFNVSGAYVGESTPAFFEKYKPEAT